MESLEAPERTRASRAVDPWARIGVAGVASARWNTGKGIGGPCWAFGVKGRTARGDASAFLKGSNGTLGAGKISGPAN